MPSDKPPFRDELDFLNAKERKMLEKLAEYSGRTPMEEIKYLIRRRVSGHLKDLGDDRGSFRLDEADLPQIRVDDAEFRG